MVESDGGESNFEENKEDEEEGGGVMSLFRNHRLVT